MTTHVHALFLITGMNPFIPEEDKEAFEKYLLDNDLEPVVTETRPITRPAAASVQSGGNKRESGRRGRGHVADIDKFLHDIDSQMDEVLEGTTNF